MLSSGSGSTRSRASVALSTSAPATKARKVAPQVSRSMPSSSQQQPSLGRYSVESQRRAHAAQEAGQEPDEIAVDDSDSENNDAQPQVEAQARADGSCTRNGRRTVTEQLAEEDSDDDLDLDLPPPLTHPMNGFATMQYTNGVDDRNADEIVPTPTMCAGEEREEDCIKILVATDNHIGYNERDPIRGRDSIETFREILQLARDNEVDMLLLAGDLFHENKPSRASLHQTVALLREYCMGSKPIALEVISDAGIGLQSGYNFPSINYEDQNYNISLPVFSIHGNHDDPQGAGPEGALCALDLLSASGLVNYFGRQELPGEATTDEQARETGIHVQPILLQKGTTKLAMYGIGNIRDERFHAEMRKNRISMFRPSENADEWFNLLLIHQNRVPHGPKSSVPENGFGDEVDLIVWGHEHDCRIDPEPVTGKAYYISQPGSSVATSLSTGESIAKHVGLLKIQGRQFDMEKLRLRTVRPFIMDEVKLTDAADIEAVQLENKVQINKYLKQRVNQLIDRANEEWDEIYQGEPEPPARMLPLIRLRVEYSNHEVGNPQRFGQDFTNRVANPRDIVQFTKRKTINRTGKVNIDQPEGIAGVDYDEDGETSERIEKIKVETLVRQYLEAQTLQMLHENGIGHAVNAYVEKDDKHAIESFITKTLEVQRKAIEKGERSQEADTDEEIEAGMQYTKTTLAQQFDERNAKKKNDRSMQAEDDEEEEEQSDFGQMSVDGSEFRSSAAPGKPKGKAAAKPAARGKNRELFRDESDENEDSDAPPLRKTAAIKTTTTASRAKATVTITSKKVPAKASQSQLAFAPARSGRAVASKSSKKAARDNDVDDDPIDDVVIDLDSDAEPPKTRKTAPKRR